MHDSEISADKKNYQSDEPLKVRLVDFPKSDDALEKSLQWDEFFANLDKLERRSDWENLNQNCPEWQKLLSGLFAASPYLSDLIVRQPIRFLDLLEQAPHTRFSNLCSELHNGVSAATSEQEVMQLLRLFKAETSLLTALCDLSGALTIMQVTKLITDAADCAIREAFNYCLRTQHNQGKIVLEDLDDPGLNSGLIVLAMGKQGAYELNYSSDVDLIVFYDAEKTPLAEGVEVGKFFVRLTRSMVKLLQERTGDGYVHRVDLRLRPDPGATAVAISLNAALHYYESMGQNWERAALIKARAVAGDIEAGNRFLKDISPFIWRRYFDFAAISDVHAMKRQIHSHKGHEKIAVAGHNIKLGRGGIREVEFFAQTQQLIAGGRQVELRGSKTLEMLEQLARFNWISDEACSEMSEAYRFLRHVEHRLQMQRDEQTHTLPDDTEGLRRLAQFSGFEDFHSFEKQLTHHMLNVQKHYAALFEDESELSGEGGNLVFTGGEDDPDTLETLFNMGFTRPQDVSRLIRSWHFGRYAATRSEKARELMTALIPKLLSLLAEAGDPQTAFLNFDSFLSKMPAGVQLISILHANPQLLRLITNIIGTAPRMAEVLAKRQHVLDALLDPDFFGILPTAELLKSHLSSSLGQSDSYEDRLDRMRAFGQEQVFLIGVRLMTNAIDFNQAGKAYSALADLLVEQAIFAANQNLSPLNGQVEGGEVAVLAMGKLGGGEMTASSDLDLQLIYDFPQDEVASNGKKPLSPSQYYIRFTQRLISALSAPTAEGTLYEVDMRLRPSGNSGPVATHLESFRDYQANDAWTWEHMALTRARAIGSDEVIKNNINNIIEQTICEKREPEKVAADVIEMRQRIHAEKGSDDPWNIKTVPGGLVDVEFIAQYLQLVYAHQYPIVVSQNTIEALQKFKVSGLLDDQQAEGLISAAQIYHKVTQVLRLCLVESFTRDECPKGLQVLLSQITDVPNISALEDLLIQNQKNVQIVFEQIIGAGAWS